MTNPLKRFNNKNKASVVLIEAIYFLRFGRYLILSNGNTGCSMIANRFPLINCLIGEPLARESLDRNPGALRVADAELLASVHAEIKFREVPIQVFLVHVLVGSHQAALEDGEKSLKRVGMHIAARPFELGMVDRFMLRFGRHHELVHLRAIGDQAAGAMQMDIERAAHVAMIEIHGTDVSVALDQGEYHRGRLRVQRGPNRLASLGGFRKEGFVGFDGDAFAAQTADVSTGGHCMTNPMSDEPRGFHAATEHALQLAGTDAFLGRTHQVDRLEPMSHRDVAVLEDGPNLDGELLAAFIALTYAWAGALARKLSDTVLIAITAVWADRASRPQMSLYVVVGGFFVFVVRGVQIRVHGCFSGMGEACA
jgi:hypothetical protein